jgi:hypothetical protein
VGNETHETGRAFYARDGSLPSLREGSPSRALSKMSQKKRQQSQESVFMILTHFSRFFQKVYVLLSELQQRPREQNEKVWLK